MEELFKTFTFRREKDGYAREYKITLPINSRDLVYEHKSDYNENNAAELKALVQLFIDQGFYPGEVEIGGGVSEVMHSGNSPFCKSYSSFSEFERHFVEDFRKAEKEEKENSNGWVTSLDYSFIGVVLKNDNGIDSVLLKQNHRFPYEPTLSLPSQLPIEVYFEVVRLSQKILKTLETR